MNLNLLKRTRLYKGYQQYEVADGIGISRQTYNYKENGKSLFNIEETARVEINEIFFDNEILK